MSDEGDDGDRLRQLDVGERHEVEPVVADEHAEAEHDEHRRHPQPAGRHRSEDAEQQQRAAGEHRAVDREVEPDRQHQPSACRGDVHPAGVQAGVDAAGGEQRRRGVPCSTRRPPSSTRTWSDRSAVDSRWAIVIDVRPRDSDSRARAMRVSVPGSTADVASSSSRHVGLAT